jgi:hypothetical protein
VRAVDGNSKRAQMRFFLMDVQSDVRMKVVVDEVEKKKEKFFVVIQ